MNPLRLFYLAFGWLCVGLGVMGVIMPILPTTPFLLLAVWAFSRSSPELAAKLRYHHLVGPYIRAWQDHGVIPVKAKIMALVMMAAMGGYIAFYSTLPLWAVYASCLVLVAVGIYIFMRPSKAPAT
jgi:uncharacterized protein